MEQILDGLTQSLDQFDTAVERGAEGRRVHIGARANLEAVADEVVQLVKILDGYNRHRFAAQPDLLAAWTAASNVVGPPVAGVRAAGRTDKPPETPSQAGQIEPAAEDGSTRRQVGNLNRHRCPGGGTRFIQFPFDATLHSQTYPKHLHAP